jgi:PAS domain S-box-containing protein
MPQAPSSADALSSGTVGRSPVHGQADEKRSFSFDDLGSRRLLHILDSADEVLSLFDVDLRHLFVSESIERITGRPRLDFIGKTNRELGFPEDLCCAWERAMQDVLHTGRTVRQSFDYPGTDGLRHFETTLEPYFEDERCTGIIAIAGDTTRRVAAERALLRSEERLRHALEAAGAGAWEVDLESGKLFISAQSIVLYGLDGGAPSTLDGWRSSVDPTDHDRVMAAFAQASAAGASPYRCEFRIRHPRLGVRWLVELGSLLCRESGTPACITGITLDITARKNEAEAKRSEEQRRDEFVATLTHELRNAVGPIFQAAHLLEPDVAAPGRTHAQRILKNQSRHLRDLLDDLNDLTAIKQGKLLLAAAPFDLRAIVDAAEEQVRPELFKRNQSLRKEISAGALLVSGDRRRLVQVLSNLLLNAAKYSPPDNEVLLRMYRDDRGRAVVAVKDSGIGLAAEDQERVFEMFSQVTGSQGGLGIGLALVKHIVGLHGGHVGVQSDGIGHGSQFTVTLPTVPDR